MIAVVALEQIADRHISKTEEPDRMKVLQKRRFIDITEFLETIGARSGSTAPDHGRRAINTRVFSKHHCHYRLA
jgi:hypothetical protein